MKPNKKRLPLPKWDLKGFWDSPTTQKIAGILAIPVGYLLLVPLAYKIEQHLKDEHGRAQISGFGGNFTVMYTGTMIAGVAIEGAKTLVPLISTPVASSKAISPT